MLLSYVCWQQLEAAWWKMSAVVGVSDITALSDHDLMVSWSFGQKDFLNKSQPVLSRDAPMNNFADHWRLLEVNFTRSLTNIWLLVSGYWHILHTWASPSGQLKNQSCCRFSCWAQTYLVINPQEQQQKLCWCQRQLSPLQLPDGRCQ